MALLHTFLLPFVFIVGSLAGDGWLGIKLADADRPTIEDVIPDSPAAKAGLRHGDVIVSIDGKAIRTVDALVEKFQDLDAGDWIKLVAQRGEKSIELKIQLTVRPVADRETKKTDEKPRKTPGKKPAKPSAKRDRRPAFLGVQIESSTRGVLVTDLVEGAPAVRSGVRRGDRLRSINGKAMSDVDEMEAIMDGLRANDRIRLQLVRGSREISIEVVLGARPGAKPQAEVRDRDRKTDRPVAVAKKPRAVARPGRKIERTSRAAAPRTTVKVQSTEFGTSLKTALANARRSGRPVIAIFGAGWCVNCETLKKSLKHSSLQGVLARYERVWIDTDKESALADKYQVESLPHMIFFTSDGKQREKVVRGYQPPQILLSALRAGLKKAPVDRRPTRGAARDKPAKRNPKKDTPTERKPPARVTDRVAPRRVVRRAATSTVNAQAREIQRLRNEIQQLRTEQRRQREMLQRIQRELQRKKK